MSTPYLRPEWCRGKVLASLESLGRPAGLDEIRRLSGVRAAFAAHALLQLEARDVIIRERNPKRQGFLWRIR